MKSVIRFADQNITEIPLNEVPREVPVIPLRNAVLFPGVLLPVFVGRTDSVRLIEAAGKPGALVGLFTQRSPGDEEVDFKGLHTTGTLAEIHRVIPMSEGGFQVLLQGVQKIELLEIKERKPFLKGRIQPLGEIQDLDVRGHAEFQEYVGRYVQVHPGIPDEIGAFVKRVTNSSALANQIVFFSQRENEEKIELLRMSSVAEKVQILKAQLAEETEQLKMDQEVRNKVEEDTSKMQREFYLRKQLEAIRKELGENDDDETDELEKQLREKNLPEHVRKAVDKELRRMRRIQESPQGGGLEGGQIRNWLELIAELPFSEPEPRAISLSTAARVLDEDHEGLEEVKKRILEYLAVEKHTGGGSRTPILCLVGPPGVGKTSLARSIARAIDRPLVRAALGGMRDEAEIRGHRRTYVGALPGKILSALKKAETRDPVFLLDEIDKTGVSYQGDPAAALLEVLDPEQNHSFEDHYLGLSYDLSRVLFICTANNLDTIPLPLRDRMEIVQISGYTLNEKAQIARKHLLPGILKDLKLEPTSIVLTDGALHRIIDAHTREAGVRSLKRKLESIARKGLRQLMEEQERNPERGAEGETLRYDTEDIEKILGRDRFYRDANEATGRPGVAVGLAWTPVGGDILYIEATAYPGRGNLRLSGQLGDVMKESAQAALSFLRAHAEELGIDAKLFHRSDIHVHIPSGAIPKDGPSAGVTLLSALASLFTGKRVAPDIAMTGEISLRGRILPVGGIKEKVLAARAAGIHRVFLPEKNRAEFAEIPEHVTEGIEAIYFADMMELLRQAVPGLPARQAEQAGIQLERHRDGW
ncbi:MAG: endopeptidase La [Spirochaetales bacterium]|nr:endopeptidase La [Spirochaetales bacterium]